VITKRAFAKGRILNILYVVQNGEDAIDFLRKEGKFKDAPTPTLVLLDLNMPKVTGFDVLEQIKGDKQLKSIPIVVLTSSERDKDIEEAYKRGCNSYIVKPVNFENFIKTVVEIKEYWLSISRVPVR
jgi:CheY-like chemotaxis protein